MVKLERSPKAQLLDAARAVRVGPKPAEKAPRKPKPPSDDKLFEWIKKQVKHTVSAFAAQRKREKEVLRFQVGDLQWSEAAIAEREGMQGGGGMPAIPPRPRVSVNKLDQPQSLVMSDARKAELGVNVHPLSEGADKDFAEMIQARYRAIERESEAMEPRLWALDRASKVGWGVYKITTRYSDYSGNPFDQDPCIERIKFQDGCGFDPSAQKADASDAEFAYESAWLSIDGLKRLYPNLQPEEFDAEALTELAGEQPDWVQADGETWAFLVLTFYKKEHEDETIWLTEDGQTVTEEPKRPMRRADGEPFMRTRDRCNVMVYTVTAKGIAQTEDWDSPYIPLVQVIGEELQPIGKDCRLRGMYEEGMGAQRMYNMFCTVLVERAGKEPKTPWQATAEQIEGYEDWYQASNVRDLPYLLYNAITVDGKPIGPPTRTQLDMTGMSIAIAGMEQADRSIQAATKVYDPSLGNSKNQESGRKVLALQGQSDAATGIFLHNLSVAMRYEAKVVLSKLKTTHDRAGRIVRTLSENGDEKAVMLNVPYMDTPKGPVAVPGWQKGMPIPQGAKYYDMSQGDYGVSVDIGKSYDTRLQEGDETLGQILSSDPTLMLLFGDIWMGMRDTPGSTEIAARLKRAIEQAHPGITADPDGTLTPEQLQSRLQAATAENQKLKQTVQQAADAIKTKQIEQQAKIQTTQMQEQTAGAKAQMDNEVKLEIARLDAQTKLSIAEITVGQQAQADKLSEILGLLKANAQMAHEARMAEKDRHHEAAIEDGTHMAAEKQREHDAAVLDAGMGQAQEEGAANRDHEREMQESAAKQTREGEA